MGMSEGHVAVTVLLLIWQQPVGSIGPHHDIPLACIVSRGNKDTSEELLFNYCKYIYRRGYSLDSWLVHNTCYPTLKMNIYNWRLWLSMHKALDLLCSTTLKKKEKGKKHVVFTSPNMSSDLYFSCYNNFIKSLKNMSEYHISKVFILLSPLHMLMEFKTCIRVLTTYKSLTPERRNPHM